MDRVWWVGWVDRIYVYGDRCSTRHNSQCCCVGELIIIRACCCGYCRRGSRGMDCEYYWWDWGNWLQFIQFRCGDCRSNSFYLDSEAFTPSLEL